jgi:hypothetical protein
MNIRTIGRKSRKRPLAASISHTRPHHSSPHITSG